MKYIIFLCCLISNATYTKHIPSIRRIAALSPHLYNSLKQQLKARLQTIEFTYNNQKTLLNAQRQQELNNVNDNLSCSAVIKANINQKYKHALEALEKEYKDQKEIIEKELEKYNIMFGMP